ncbi:Histone H4 [Mycena indigotica]|uniref:Histone H4 n=1 Tax=Mycena indigotica TaxID=2126181 RepID=A0A8H6S0Q8_9AGAR|nr:Histone H4 [Mycena indigotica]KAF7290541.1 Histone H4 [Mycena indigotica]
MSRARPRATEFITKVYERSQKPPATDKGAQDHDLPKPIIKPDQRVRTTAMRIAKAERDERMDITRVLTPVKTFMGGFTRPQNLSTAHWFPGGSYIIKGRVYEKPSPAAYEAHTVFLLESRYHIRYKPGRTEAPEYIYGVCREADLPAVLRNYNSKRTPLNIRTIMDNARWPWGPQKKRKRVFGGYVSEPQTPVPVDEDQATQTRELLQDSSPVNILSSLRAFQPSAEEEITDKPVTSPGVVEAVPPTEDEELASEETDLSLFVPRSEYLQTLEKTPFWRPVITLTVSTRPLALSLLRLANRHATGLPFYASVSDDDRKSFTSFPARMRSLRLRRIQDLSLELASVLTGARGGIPGIRFEHESNGRGIAGEGLADPIPWDKRVIHVGLGTSLPSWVQSEFPKVLLGRAKVEVPGWKPFELYHVDDFGNRSRMLDGQALPWARPEHSFADRNLEEWYTEYCILRRVLKIYQSAAEELNRMRDEGKMSQRTRTLVPNPNQSIDSSQMVQPEGNVASREQEVNNDGESGEVEEVLLEDDGPEDPSFKSARPLMFIREGPDALKNFSRRVLGIIDETSSLDELDEPPDFVVLRGGPIDGEKPLSVTSTTPILGPRDPLTGELHRTAVLQEMGYLRFVPLNLAIRAVTRRYQLWAVKKKEELSRQLPTRHAQVDYPDTPRRLY